MTSSIETMLDLEAEKQAEIDELSEDKQGAAAERINDLLYSADERDPEIFEGIFEIDTAITLADYAAVPRQDRDIGWSIGLASMFAAVQAQVWVELFGLDFLTRSEKAGILIEQHRTKMDRNDLITASKQGFSKARIGRARERMANANA